MISVGLASLALAFVLSGVFFVGGQVPERLCATSLLLTLASPLVALAALGTGLVDRRNPRAQTGRRLSYCALALVGMRLFIFPFGYPPCGERVISNSASAVGSLRTLHTACENYRARYRSYPEDLEKLGPVNGGESRA